MANQPNSSVARDWASVSDKIAALHQQLKAGAGNKRTIEGQLARAEEVLLDLPAPHLSGTFRKLEMLWEATLHGLDQDSQRKLQILRELRSHIAA